MASLGEQCVHHSARAVCPVIEQKRSRDIFTRPPRRHLPEFDFFIKGIGTHDQMWSQYLCNHFASLSHFLADAQLQRRLKRQDPEARRKEFAVGEPLQRYVSERLVDINAVKMG